MSDDSISNVASPATGSDDPDPEPAASSEYQDSDDGLATLEDHTLQRDETGGLQPQRIREIQELGGADVIAKPLTRQERRQYIEELVDDSTDKEEITDAELAELFDTKIVRPDLAQHDLCQPEGHVTERFVREGLTGKQEDGYYIAVLRASGEDDMVRQMRGELADKELRAFIAQEHGTVPGNPRQGDGFRDGVDSNGSDR